MVSKNVMLYLRSLECKGTYVHASGADWPLGAPGRFPVAWRLIWPAALCFLIYFFIIFFNLFFAFPMCQSDPFRLWHSLIDRKKIINRLVLTGSAVLHVTVPCLRQTVLNRVDARKERKWQKKWLNVAKLLTCSGLQVQVSFICNMLL